MIQDVKIKFSAVNSCQSAVKLDLQKLLNLTLSAIGQVVENPLSLTQLNSNLQKIHSKAPEKFEQLSLKFSIN